MIGNDLYEILNVPKGSSLEDIRKSYKKLAMKFHPDRNKEHKDIAEQQFKEIANAYNILSNEEEKIKYDKTSFFFSQEFNFNDIFDTLLNKKTQIHKPDLNIHKTLSLSLKDVIYGKNINMYIEKKILCSLCKTNELSICSSCNGTGKINTIDIGLSFGFVQDCSQCQNGKVYHFSKDCCICNGNGLSISKENVYINIPPGVSHNQVLSFKHQGHQHYLSEYGSLDIHLNIDNKTNYKQIGNHLLFVYDINLVDALCGKKIYITYIDNTILDFDCNDIIYPNKLIVIKEYGLPIYKSDKKGDLIIQFNIIFPKKINKEKVKKVLGKSQEEKKEYLSKDMNENIIVLDEVQNKRLLEELNKDYEKI